MLPHFPRKSLYHTLLCQDSVFFVIDALLDTLSMATDLKFKMVLTLSLALPQPVQVFNLHQFGLDDVELQVEIF